MSRRKKKEEGKVNIGDITDAAIVGRGSSVLQKAEHSPITSCPPLIKGCLYGH